MTYTYNTKSGIGIGNHYWNDIFNMLVANPILPMYDENGQYTDFDDIEKTGLWSLDPYVTNPLLSMTRTSRGNNQSQSHALNLSANLRIQPIKNLIFRSQVNYRMSASTYRQYGMTYTGSQYDKAETDAVSQSASAGWSWSWENTLNYKFNIAEKNHFDALVGSTLEHSGFGESVNAARSGGAWPDDYLHAYVGNMIGTVDPADIGGSTWGDSGLASFFGRVNYDYDEKYMLSAIIRADGSSNFAPGHRWGVFPSVAAGWVVSSEPWMEGTKNVLDYLKIRASWGQNGNCAVDNFQYLATVSIGPDNGGYAFGHGALENWQTGSYADKLANADISWETSEQIDLGFDARFFNNRLNLTFDWYQKNTKDWLVNAPVMGHFGTGAPYINGGDVRNSGVELSLNWSDAINKDFSYSFGVNGSYNKNIITRIANDEGIIHGPGSVVQGIDEIYRAQVGYPIGYFWAYKTDGVFQNQAEIDRVRKITFEDIVAMNGKHPTNPNIQLDVLPVDNFETVMITDMVKRIIDSDRNDTPCIMIMCNPNPTYIKVAYMLQQLKVNMRNVKFYMMDEWADEDGNVAPLTYGAGLGYSFRNHFYGRIREDLRPDVENWHVFTNENKGEGVYSSIIEEISGGGVDVVYAASGWPGHTAFIDPRTEEFKADSLEEFCELGSRIVTTTPLTICENSQFGPMGASGDVWAVPYKAATIGPRDICHAKERVELHKFAVPKSFI